MNYLERARDAARERDQWVGVAISEYQMSLRLSDEEGSRLAERARDTIRRAGGAERLLDEDPGLR